MFRCKPERGPGHVMAAFLSPSSLSASASVPFMTFGRESHVITQRHGVELRHLGGATAVVREKVSFPLSLPRLFLVCEAGYSAARLTRHSGPAQPHQINTKHLKEHKILFFAGAGTSCSPRPVLAASTVTFRFTFAYQAE